MIFKISVLIQVIIISDKMKYSKARSKISWVYMEAQKTKNKYKKKITTNF